MLDGRLDVLVNYAGRGMSYISETSMVEPTRFWEASSEVWRMIIEANVNGPFFMAKHATPVMLKAGWGRQTEDNLAAHGAPLYSEFSRAIEGPFTR